jgi:prolyl-tRNA synthetase
LPLLLNQWANVVRWELRPRLFLRSSEFLWQEGHTAHASYEDAQAYANKIHLEVYNDFLNEVLAVPTFLGIKPPRERFAGAINTLTCEGMMRDGKALQLATSHELGQNFARAFEIYYQSEEGQAELCYTTSWGSSTRLVGGLIMAHGDDQGLLVPPRLAPTQVVVIAVRDEPEVNEACERLQAQLIAQGVRSTLDRSRGSFGRRVTDWEIKGVPLRVEVGPRDLNEGVVSVTRRDNGEKLTWPLAGVAQEATKLLATIQRDLYARALEWRDVNTLDVPSVVEAIDVAQTGFAKLSWDLVGASEEAQMNNEAVTVRCLQRADGSIPESELENDLLCIVAKSY